MSDAASTRRAVVLSALLLAPGCVTESIACGFDHTVDFSQSAPEEGEWRLVHVNPDGSVTVARDGNERTLPSPGLPRREGQVIVLASDPRAQSATLEFPGWRRTTRWLWWEWASDDED